MSYPWWQYEEADTYEGKVVIQNADRQKASFAVPKDASVGKTIHIILEVTDSGTPQLSRYRRVICRLTE